MPAHRTTARAPRLAAALIALTAAAGLAAGYAAVLDRTGSHAAAVARMLNYFTNTTGLVVAILFGAIALRPGSWLRPWPVAGTALACLLVGIVQRLLLAGLRVPQGADRVADILLHLAVPALVPLFWLTFVPKGSLRYRDALLWALYPLAFLAVTLVRGATTDWYPYPFVNVARFGWAAVMANVGGIAAGFLATGAALVALDRRLGAAARSDPRP
ncbi:hypothetical protein DK427_17795 [Methylobacterium radiodurans]|uniref:Integral membrane protein n=1 Tax=Methylobacterium radiodurans TaxID=2202828 RepID=A0A2U8VZ62_9HYPH|nr:hypothetical protein DK427_17795 [Methylobacterium radiodurans]